MRYWDTTFDKMFDEAIDELEKQQIEAQAQEAYNNANVGNPNALYGAI